MRNWPVPLRPGRRSRAGCACWPATWSPSAAWPARLIAARGRDSDVISACSQIIRDTAARLLERAQRAGAARTDLTAPDVMMLVHGVVVATERTPEQADRLLSLTLDGLRARDKDGDAGNDAGGEQS